MPLMEEKISDYVGRMNEKTNVSVLPGTGTGCVTELLTVENVWRVSNVFLFCVVPNVGATGGRSRRTTADEFILVKEVRERGSHEAAKKRSPSLHNSKLIGRSMDSNKNNKLINKGGSADVPGVPGLSLIHI